MKQREAWWERADMNMSGIRKHCQLWSRRTMMIWFSKWKKWKNWRIEPMPRYETLTRVKIFACFIIHQIAQNLVLLLRNGLPSERWCKQTSMCETTCCLLLMNEHLIETDKVWYCEQRVEDLENATMTVSWERKPCMPAKTSENWTTYAKWKQDSNQKNSSHSTKHAETINNRKVTVIVNNKCAWRDHNDGCNRMWMLNEKPNNEWRSILDESNKEQWMTIRF